MESKKILDVGSIISDFNQGAASKFGRLFQDTLTNQDKKENPKEQTNKYEDKEQPIGDYDAIFRELCTILENIRQKWGNNDTDCEALNPYYQRDLLYLYDRITLDMTYLKWNTNRNAEWLDKLQELKFEIRNML